MKKDSQKTMVLRYLSQGYELTPLEALVKFRCMRLAAVVFFLKEDGHDIVTEIKHRNGKRFASYRLNQRG